MKRALAAAILLGTTAAAPADEIVRNWFHDPYFQVRDGIPGCPAPLGPYTTEEQMLKETHYRSERGTRCWLEKKCSKPSSYLYDPGIAAAVRSRFDASATLRDASIWITVQRRFVWIEGCVSAKASEREIAKLMKDVPDVERTIVNVFRSNGALPYRILGEGQRRGADAPDPK